MYKRQNHGTAYGDDGYTGHRLGHPSVWTVPYAHFFLEPTGSTDSTKLTGPTEQTVTTEPTGSAKPAETTGPADTAVPAVPVSRTAPHEPGATR